MKKNVYKLLVSFLSLFLIFSSSVPVHAKDSGLELLNYNEMTKEDRYKLITANILAFISDLTGVYINQAFGGGGGASIRDAMVELLIEQKKIDSADDVADYIDSHVSYSDEKKELYVDATMSDDLHDALKAYLDANTGWYNVPTVSYKNASVSYFTSSQQFKTFCEIGDSMSDNQLLYINYIPSSHTFEEGGKPESAMSCYLHTYDAFLFRNSGSFKETSDCIQIYYEWLSSVPVSDLYIALNGQYDLRPKNNFSYDGSFHVPYSEDRPHLMFTKNGGTVRVYKTINDMKSYSVNQQPYYTTSKWTNYVSGQGNTITQQEFNAPVTYQDIVNNISGDTTINNGISPEQLEQIIDAIIETMKGNSGSGGSGGSGSGDSGGSGGGSSGGGLSDLLSGLGALGDVILSVLGKLSEYLGKAMALFSDVVLGIIDKVPKGFTDLLSAFFPFIPEEWTIAIGLGIVLTIILGIVRIFKK